MVRLREQTFSERSGGDKQEVRWPRTWTPQEFPILDHISILWHYFHNKQARQTCCFYFSPVVICRQVQVSLPEQVLNSSLLTSLKCLAVRTLSLYLSAQGISFLNPVEYLPSFRSQDHPAETCPQQRFYDCTRIRLRYQDLIQWESWDHVLIRPSVQRWRHHFDLCLCMSMFLGVYLGNRSGTSLRFWEIEYFAPSFIQSLKKMFPPLDIFKFSLR